MSVEPYPQPENSSRATASGDLTIGLTQSSYLHTLWVFQRTIKRRLPFVATIPDFRDLKGG